MSEPFARPGTTLCIVSLTYGADLDAIDAAMSDHVDWLRACYVEGRLIASGRKQPRTGGIIMPGGGGGGDGHGVLVGPESGAFR